MAKLWFLTISVLLMATRGVSDSAISPTFDEALPGHVSVGKIYPPFLYMWRDNRSLLLWQHNSKSKYGTRLVLMDILSGKIEPQPTLENLTDRTRAGNAGISINSGFAAWVEQQPSLYSLMVVGVDGTAYKQIDISDDLMWTRPVWITNESAAIQHKMAKNKPSANLVMFGRTKMSQDTEITMLTWSSVSGKLEQQVIGDSSLSNCFSIHSMLGTTSGQRVLLSDWAADDPKKQSVTLCLVDPHAHPIEITKHVCKLPTGAKLWSLALGPHTDTLAWLLRFEEPNAGGKQNVHFEIWVSATDGSRLTAAQGIVVTSPTSPFPAAFQWLPDGKHLSLLQGNDLEIFSVKEP